MSREECGEGNKTGGRRGGRRGGEALPLSVFSAPLPLAWLTEEGRPTSRGLHSFPFPLNLSLLCPNSAQFAPFRST